MPDEPLVRFHRLIASTRLPQRADRAAGGTLPARAARYCDAVTSASAFGYYLFAPMALSLLWDGSEIFWRYPGLDTWLPLGAAQFPHFAAAFDEAAPPVLEGCAPPFLTVLPEPGCLQIWTGLIARTAPDWSLLLRPLANFPGQGGFVPFEGIVEADRWFGPLFTNLRLTRSHSPIHLNPDLPLIQAQPLPRAVYADATLNRFAATPDMAALTAQDWDAYRRSIVVPNGDPGRPPGAYAVAGRRRRRDRAADAPVMIPESAAPRRCAAPPGTETP